MSSSPGLTLLIDGSAQSHVDPVDPTHLFFEYVRRIGHVLDAVARAGAPIRVLHLGGGAMTLPVRRRHAPGVVQVVVEVDAEVVDAVRERAVAGRRHRGRARRRRDAIEPDRARRPRFDVVVVDLYARLEAPAFVDDPTFIAGCLAALAAGGLVVVNVADAPGLTRLRAGARVRPGRPGSRTARRRRPRHVRRRRGGQRDPRRGARTASPTVSPSGSPGRGLPRRRAHRAPARRGALGRVLSRAGPALGAARAQAAWRSG